MRTLAIDTASHEACLACVDDVVRSIVRIGRLHDSEMIPAIDGVLKEAGWKAADIERIACNVGPGGFTSVRSGITLANALADQLDVPLAGYHGSMLMGARCQGFDGLTLTTLWIHSTRKDQVFIRGGPWEEPALVSFADALSAIEKGTCIVGDLLPEHRTTVEERGGVFPGMHPIENVLPAFLDGFSYEKRMLVPWYGRGI